MRFRRPHGIPVPILLKSSFCKDLFSKPVRTGTRLFFERPYFLGNPNISLAFSLKDAFQKRIGTLQTALQRPYKGLEKQKQKALKRLSPSITLSCSFNEPLKNYRGLKPKAFQRGWQPLHYPTSKTLFKKR